MTFRPWDTLEGKTAVITGATGGIGFVTAERLARRGARIIGIVRRNLEDAQAKLNTLPCSSKEPHLALLADVTNKAQIQEATLSINRCDILVQSTGSTKRIPHDKIELLTDAYFDEMTRDNLRSYFTVIRAFAPLLRKSRESVIVNIGSVAGNAHTAGAGSNIAYGAAKAGLDALTRNLSRSLAPDIRVVGVSPGIVDTTFVTKAFDNYPNLESIANGTPLRRIATTEDIAATVEALTTLMRYSTGIVICVDGGRTL